MTLAILWKRASPCFVHVEERLLGPVFLKLALQLYKGVSPGYLIPAKFPWEFLKIENQVLHTKKNVFLIKKTIV